MSTERHREQYLLAFARSPAGSRRTANQWASPLRELVEPLIEQGRSYKFIAIWLNSKHVSTRQGGLMWHTETAKRLIRRLELR